MGKEGAAIAETPSSEVIDTGTILHWGREDYHVWFEAEKNCTILFQNPAYFGKVYLGLEGGKRAYLAVKDADTNCDFLILGSANLLTITRGEYPPIT